MLLVNHLSRMDLVARISRTSSIPVLWVLDGIFLSVPNSYRILFKQTVKILIRHRIKCV